MVDFESAPGTGTGEAAGGARAPRRRGAWLRVVGVLALLGVGVAFAAGAAVASAGMVRVSIHEKKPGGIQLTLPPIPVRVLTIGASFIPPRARLRMDRHLASIVPPLRAALQELEHCPDG